MMQGLLFSKILDFSFVGCYSILIVLAARLLLIRCKRKYAYYLWFIVFLNLCIPFSFQGIYSLIPKQVAEISFTEYVNEKNLQLENQNTINMSDNIQENQKGTEINSQKSQNFQKRFSEKQENYFQQDIDGEQNKQNRQDIDQEEQKTQKQQNNPSIPQETKRFGQEEIEQLNNHSSDKTFMQKLMEIAQVVWLMGILGIFLYSIFCIMRIKSQIEEGSIVRWDAKRRIAEVQGISSSFLWGICRPVIYLPANLSSDEKRYIIAHEYCHKRRKDYFIKIVVFAITAVYWFQPLVWVAYLLFCRDMEISCDEEVLVRTSGNMRKQYASSLLKFAAKQNGYIMIPFAFGEPFVKWRIKNVLHFHTRNRVVSAFGILFMAGVALGLVFRPVTAKEGNQTNTYYADKPWELLTAEKEENITQALVSNQQNGIISTLVAGEDNQDVNLSNQPENGNAEKDHYQTENKETNFLSEVVNNGGNIIQVKGRLYYKNGLELYSDGSYLYASHKGDSIQDTFRYDLEGNGYVKLFNGIIVDCNSTGEILYYIANEANSNQTPGSLYAYNTSNRQSYLLLKGELTYLDRKNGYLYVAREETDGIFIDCICETDGTIEKNILHQKLDVQQITSFYIDDAYILLAAGNYTGTIRNFAGVFYSYHRSTEELSEIHCTEANRFQVADGYVYYHKYDGTEYGGLCRSDFDFQKEEVISYHYLDIVAWDKTTNTLLVSKNVGRNNYLSNLVRVNLDGSNEQDLLRADQFHLKIQDYDKIRFSEIAIIEDKIYVKVQQWGFRGKSGFLDNLIWEQYYQVAADGSKQSLWNP